MTVLINISSVGIKHRGMGYFTKEVVKHLIKNRQHQYIFVSNTEISHEFQAIIEKNNYLLIQIRVPLPLFEQFVIPYFIYKYSPDICWFPSNTFPLIKFRSTKYIATIHDLIFLDKKFTPLTMYQKIGRLYRKININLGIKKLDTVTSVSNVSLEKIYKQYDLGVFNANQVLYNSFSPIELTSKNRSVLDKFALQDKKYIYTISGDADHKNFKFLIESFQRLYLYDNSYTLVVSGTKKKYTDHPNIIYTSYITEEEKFVLLRYAELFVFVSLEEGFGIPLLEGMYYSNNVLVSDIAIFREIGQDYVYYCNPYNTDFLLQYIQNLPNNMYSQDDRIKYIRENFNVDKSVKKLENIFSRFCL